MLQTRRGSLLLCQHMVTNSDWSLRHLATTTNPTISLLGSQSFDGINSSGTACWQIACQCCCSDQDNWDGYECDWIEWADAKQQCSHEAHECGCRAKADSRANTGEHQR
jgi:hypothetical protein